MRIPFHERLSERRAVCILPSLLAGGEEETPETEKCGLEAVQKRHRSKRGACDSHGVVSSECCGSSFELHPPSGVDFKRQRHLRKRIMASADFFGK
mmetsp:Transcript_82723/g.146034  ORF Transcript_82723/g.146034 Transcript_82723/m.146034 type:complete len:96 (+) Transcript_82723:1016-1303(+)